MARVAAAAAEHGAAIPVVPVAETLKRVVDGQVAATIDRTLLAAAQTPQGIRRDVLARAWAERPPGDVAVWTDEAALLEACRIPVHAVPGESTNLKVTLPDDLAQVEAALMARGRCCCRPPVPRVGFGDDGHPFGPGAPLALGGLLIDGAPRLHGHSDGDVALHAVCEALLGRPAWATSAASSRPARPRRRASPARRCSAACLARVAAAGYAPVAIDVTLVGARPRLAGYLDAMAAAIAARVGLAADCVNVKASSGNLAGFEGAGRGISARAVAVVVPHGRESEAIVTVRLHDTLSGSVRALEPLEPGHVRVYSCGPTVYGPAHVGNFRSFLFADLLVRHLRWRGLQVTWVMNLTDVDDKIIRGAAGERIGIDALAERWIAPVPRGCRHAAHDEAGRHAPGDRAHSPDGVPPRAPPGRRPRVPDRGRLGLLPDRKLARATAAWRGSTPTSCGSASASLPTSTRRTTFATSSSGRALAQGEPSWETAVGPGRPGWHLECSAMSMHYLGESFDVHTGGVDLVFPHHEDEIAQSEAATGKPFVGTWLHCAHLQMGGRKMAKSDGNIARVADILAAGTSPRALRYALLAAHYRTGLSFSDESLSAATAAVERLDAVAAALEAYHAAGPDDPALPGVVAAAREAFGNALDDDLAISPALGALFDLVRDLNRRIAERTLSSSDAGVALGALRDLDEVLGLLPDPVDVLPADLAALLDARAAARAEPDWAASDRLRDELAAAGIVVEDSRDGQRWRRAGGPPGA